MTKLLRTSHNSLASCPGCDACDALLQAQPMGATPMGRPKLKSSALLAVLEIKNLSTVAEGCALITRCKRCPAEIIEVALDCLKASLVPTVQARGSQVFLSQSQLPSPDAEPHELKDLSPVVHTHGVSPRPT